ERVQPVQAAKDEAVDGFGGEVPLMLVPAEQLVERRARDELACQHARRAQLRQDMRHADHGMPLVVARKEVLAFRLAHVVDLFLEARAELVDQRAGVETWERGADDAPQEPDVAEVGGDAASDARVLHLDRYRAAVLGDGAVDLADGRGRDGERIPVCEDALGHVAELVDDDHRRGDCAHERMRSSIRCLASSTPGSDSNTRSIAPSSWRTDSRSISPEGGASKPYIARAQSGSVPTATWASSVHRSRSLASRSGVSTTTAVASL